MKNNEHIIGHGSYQFIPEPGWGIPPSGKHPVKDCHEMVIDQQNRLYLLTNDTRNNIIIYNKDGKITGSWGNEFPGGHGLTFHDENGEGFLYITDTILNEVVKLTLAGRKIMTLPYPRMISDYSDPGMYKPTETAIAPNGDIYVTDGYGLQYVIQYTSRGEYIRHWGGKGNKPENFDCAHGITIDDRNMTEISLLVTSRNENVFKRFSLDGNYLETIALPGSFVCRPVIYGDSIYAAVFRSEHNQNTASGYLTILDKNNKVVSTPGGTEPVYTNNLLVPQKKQGSVFIHPHDVCIDEDGSLYVPQWNSGATYPVKLHRA